MQQASDMARKALEADELGEDEMQPAPKLLEVILQNCRGKVDQYLPLYMQASLSHHYACVCRPMHLLAYAIVEFASYKLDTLFMPWNGLMQLCPAIQDLSWLYFFLLLILVASCQVCCLHELYSPPAHAATNTKSLCMIAFPAYMHVLMSCHTLALFTIVL